ncbi:MAG: DUF2235 domain-containing protein, partial [Rhizobacter sp.]
LASSAANGCQQRIKISFFFDGTGNNLDADTHTEEHSNVARLYRAHIKDDARTSTYRRYIPGLGTYFRAIGDPGGTASGKAAGAYGQERLDWALKEFATILQAAERQASDNKSRIIEVRLAVFGFSRGATSARAFCRELQTLCIGQRGTYKLRSGAVGASGIFLRGGFPIDVYFLGIFDTVASVGLPMAANNFTSPRRNQNTWRGAGGLGQDDLRGLAFGEPGADPSPGLADGHGSWADDLRIADVVSQCVHMVAGHEIRNSFPLDSALDGMSYPHGLREMVFPGVHSDVGGGYRQGEGGKSSLLSRVPLRAMLSEATKAGVPLRTLGQMLSTDEKRDFAIDDASVSAFTQMAVLWTKYMSGVSSGGQPLGSVVLSHMRQYWKYRITVAVERSNPANAGNGNSRTSRARVLTEEQKTIANNEKEFTRTRASLQADALNKRKSYAMVSAQKGNAQQALDAARSSPGYSNQIPMWKAQVASLEAQEAEAHDRWRTAQAKVDGAANDSELIESLDNYDAWLLQDAEWLHRMHQMSPTRRMRPHYRALLDAYQEVVVAKQPVPTDSDLYKFFQLYVHDSLAGFATDNTRPSDPRVIYIGDDAKYRYAATKPTGEAVASA